MANGALIKTIEGLWAERVNKEEDGVASFRAAPAHTAVSGRYEYQRLAQDGRPDTLDLHFDQNLTDFDQHARLDLPYETVAGATDRVDAGWIPLPQSLIDRLNAGNGFNDVEMRAEAKIINYALWQHSRRLRAAMVTSGVTAPSAGAMVLTSPGFDLAAYVDSTIEEIELASGKTPNMIYLGQEAARRMLTNDTIFGQGGLSIGPAVPGVERRTGYAEMGALTAFFASRGLDLVVDKTSQRAGNTISRVWGDRAIIGYAAKYDGFAFTAVENGDFSEMLKVSVRESTAPNPVGLDLTGDCFFAVEVADVAAARFATVTL